MTGLYTEITEIVAPRSAVAGSRVDVTVRVKNIDTLFDHLVACVAIYDGSGHFIDQAVNIPSGATHSFSGSFDIPGWGVTIYAYSYYPVGEEWILDDEAQKAVSLSELVPGFSDLAISSLTKL